MSNVLEFRPASAEGAVKGRVSHSAVADIVIFPGVRYERAQDPSEPSPTSSRGGRGKSVRRGANK